MWHGSIVGVWLAAADESAFSPQEWLIQRGVPRSLVEVVLVVAFVIATGAVLFKPAQWLWGRRPRWLRRDERTTTPSAEDLAAWETHLRLRMGELWVSGDRAPLKAAERDSPSSLQYLRFKGDPALLHPTRRSATAIATGDPIALDDDLGPGGLFGLLDGSMLIVGAPGAGKSVLLWQILRDRLAEDDAAATSVPVLIELHRWSTLDTGEGPVPPFEDFVVAELSAPAVGVPRDRVPGLIASYRLIYLLDGLDELSDDHALRCLRALGTFAQAPGDRPRRRIALTCREHDYDRLLGQRRTGTSAVVNALRITPFPPEAIEVAFARADPSPGQLREAAGRLPTLGRMLGTPLWLSIAEDVYGHYPDADPLATLDPDDDAAQIETALFSRWLDLRLPVGSTPRRQLASLAALMRANGLQTLYLEAVQPVWLTPAGYERTAARLAALAVGLGFGLVVGLVSWLGFGLGFGLVAGLASWLVVGLVAAAEMQDPPVVADRPWSWRAALTRQSLAAGLDAGLAGGLVTGLVTGLGVWLDAGRDAGLAVGLRGGLAGALSLGLVGVLLAAWSTVPAVEGRSARPTDALLRSAGHGATIVLVVGLVCGLVGALVFGPVGALAFGLVGGPLAGLGLGLSAGLSALVAHTATRITAAVHGLLPIRLVAFLRDAATLGIMYPAGPGYRFRHRTLAEHIASEDSNTAP